MIAIRFAPRRDRPALPRRLFSLKVGVTAVGLAGAVLATDGGPLPLLQLPGTAPQLATPTADDVLALRVQQALADHPDLKRHRLNLMVNVVDGVAVIGGPVPADGLGPTIEATAKATDGVRSARVTVWVPATVPTDPFVRALDDKLRVQPPVERAKPTTTEPPPVLLSLPDDRPKAEVTTKPTGGSVVRHPAPPLLLDPVVSVSADRPPPPRVPGAEPPPYPTIPPTALPTTPVPEDQAWTADPKPRAAAAVTDDRRDTRFARLTVDVKDGVAVISGRAGRHADAWEYADEVRKRPDVTRVVVGRVEVR